MIETALVFALGALLSGLVALLALPAFTRRAARLARREMEARLPRTLDEIAAMRDGTRAEYAARTARVEAALEGARREIVDERLAKAEMSVEVASLRAEKRAYETNLAEAEDRISAAFAELRDREERLARASAENRELERRVTTLEQRLRQAEARAAEAERIAGEVRVALVSAEANRLAVTDAFTAHTGHRIEIAAAEPVVDAPALPAPAIDEPAAVPSWIPREIRPELAAAVTERLRAARALARSGDGLGPRSGAAGPGGPTLPVAAEWTLPKIEIIEIAPEEPAEIEAPAPSALPPPAMGHEPDEAPALPAPSPAAEPERSAPVRARPEVAAEVAAPVPPPGVRLPLGSWDHGLPRTYVRQPVPTVLRRPPLRVRTGGPADGSEPARPRAVDGPTGTSAGLAPAPAEPDPSTDARTRREADLAEGIRRLRQGRRPGPARG